MGLMNSTKNMLNSNKNKLNSVYIYILKKKKKGFLTNGKHNLKVQEIS